MLLYLVRHGLAGEPEPSKEIRLDSLGKIQARKIGKRLSKEKFDAVYVSTAKRTLETFEIMKKYLKYKKCFIDNYYQEVYGGLLGNSTRPMPKNIKNKEEKKGVAQKIKMNRLGLDKFWKQMLKYPYHAKVLLIGHGNFINVMLGTILGIKSRELHSKHIIIANASLSIVAISKTKPCGIFLLNDTCHLKEKELTY